MSDKGNKQNEISVEHLMKEFDELKNTVSKRDLIEVMKQRYDLSEDQSQQLIIEAKARNLLMDTSRYGKRGYLKKDTRFSPIEDYA